MSRRLNKCVTCDGKTRHNNRVCAACRETTAILADPATMAALAEVDQ